LSGFEASAERQALLFLKKTWTPGAKQKDFSILGHGRDSQMPQAQNNKSFLRRFFSKKRLLS
jgi:hypothetical protein